MMKKSKLLIAMLVMLVAASGYAQDSYRQAVKDYLTSVNQFEQEKMYLSNLSMMFKRDGQVDIDQLTKRYLEERYEDDAVDFYASAWAEQGMTEADLKELSSLLSTPEFEVFTGHFKNWMKGVASYMMTPLMERMKVLEEPMDPGEYMDKVKNYVSFVDSPIQPRPEIDAAYAEKFNHVMSDSFPVKFMMDEMLKRFDEKATLDDPVLQESGAKVKDWMTKNMPVLLLNYAYDNLTLEDLDYATKLYANETYSKFQTFDMSKVDMESLRTKHAYFKYLNWMEEQGAKATEDPSAVFGLLKSIYDSIIPSK